MTMVIILEQDGSLHDSITLHNHRGILDAWLHIWRLKGFVSPEEISVKRSKEVLSPDKEVSGLGGSSGTPIKICSSVMFSGKAWVGRLGKGLV